MIQSNQLSRFGHAYCKNFQAKLEKNLTIDFYQIREIMASLFIYSDPQINLTNSVFLLLWNLQLFRLYNILQYTFET